MDIKNLKDVLDYNPETGIFRWRVTLSNRAQKGSIAGSRGRQNYLTIQVYGKAYMAHRLACILNGMDIEGLDVDHINGVVDDNRLCNLRPADRCQNRHNMKISKTNTSGTKGVVWLKTRNLWRVQIGAFGKRHIIGFYAGKEEAIAAASTAREELHGEYARHA